MDMAANMIKAICRCFTNASRVIDRFHVQKLAYDAVQEARIPRVCCGISDNSINN